MLRSFTLPLRLTGMSDTVRSCVSIVRVSEACRRFERPSSLTEYLPYLISRAVIVRIPEVCRLSVLPDGPFTSKSAAMFPDIPRSLRSAKGFIIPSRTLVSVDGIDIERSIIGLVLKSLISPFSLAESLLRVSSAVSIFRRDFFEFILTLKLNADARSCKTLPEEPAILISSSWIIISPEAETSSGERLCIFRLMSVRLLNSGSSPI